MKDKKDMLEVNGPVESNPPVKVEMVERLSDADKATLDLAKVKKELALEKARTSVAQSELSEVTYNNIILQLALKYGLKDGDNIETDGSIKRK
jgi:hypothetical protein